MANIVVTIFAKVVDPTDFLRCRLVRTDGRLQDQVIVPITTKHVQFPTVRNGEYQIEVERMTADGEPIRGVVTDLLTVVNQDFLDSEPSMSPVDDELMAYASTIPSARWGAAAEWLRKQAR